MDVGALRCRCGNIGLCLKSPPKEVDIRSFFNQHRSAIPPVFGQRLGLASLLSALHRVPELVKATEFMTDPESKWRCYECRSCRAEAYACRIRPRGVNTSVGGSTDAQPPQPLAFTTCPSSDELLAEDILINLEELAAEAAAPADDPSYSAVFGMLLPSVAQQAGRTADISKLLGAAGTVGLQLFERLTDQVDNWFARHVKELSERGSVELRTEQQKEIRKKALRERDLLFTRICQENGIGHDFMPQAKAARMVSLMNKGALLADGTMNDDDDFETRCNDLRDFKQRHGHCRVPRGWRENVDLSNWVRNLRRKKIRGTLAADRIAKLDELGFVWRKERKDSWEEHFAQLVGFKKRFGHCRVSRNWNENVKLGQWVQSLRRLKLAGRLNGEKIARLEGIGFEWRLRQKEDGVSKGSRDGEIRSSNQDEDDDDDGGDLADERSQWDDSDEDQDGDHLAAEAKEPLERLTWLAQLRDASRSSDTRLSLQPFAAANGDGMKTSSPATTTSRSKQQQPTPTLGRSKQVKARLPTSPSFSVHDIDEDLDCGYADNDDDDDDDDGEFFTALGEEDDEDADWDEEAEAKTPNSAKRKRTSDNSRSKGRSRSSSAGSRAAAALATSQDGGTRACMECGATKTPHWRRGPTTQHGDPAFLCNACGLRYYKTLQKSPATKRTRGGPSKKPKLSAEKGEDGSHAALHRRRHHQDHHQEQQQQEQQEDGGERRKGKEVVTDSDSESREELPEQHSSAALVSEQDETVAEQTIADEMAHVSWLLAFKEQRRRKSLSRNNDNTPPAAGSAAGGAASSSSAATQGESPIDEPEVQPRALPLPVASRSSPVELNVSTAGDDEDNEVFDFVE